MSSRRVPFERLCRFLAVSTTLAVGACDDDSLPIAETRYRVAFSLEETTGPVGALQIEVTYRGNGNGGWEGAGGSVGCRWIVQASLHACNDKRGGELSCAIVDTGGFAGPTPLMECDFVATSDAVTAEDFKVKVVDASAPDLSPIDVEVTANVAKLTLASTTTTADPDNPPTEYTVTFEMSPYRTELDVIDALQVEIVANGARGAWIGSGAAVDCTWLVDDDLAVCTKQSNSTLECAIVNTVGFAIPSPFLECGFVSSDPVVDESDFAAFITDVSTTSGAVSDAYRVDAVSVIPR